MNLVNSQAIITELVDNRISSPFLFWPRTTKNNITKYLSKTIIEDSQNGRAFFFEKENKAYLYFKIQDLPWDSEHFKYKCATIKHFYIDEEINFRDIDKIKGSILPDFEKYLKNENIRFISADVASQSKNGNYFIQLLGFRFILNWIDGIWSPKVFKQSNSGFKVRNILPNEVEMFSDISSSSYYKEGRFYFDKEFDSFAVDKLYGDLIKNSFLADDIILSCWEEKTPIGIFVCRKLKSYPEFNNLKVAHLRFLLINPSYRGKLYGYRIFEKTLEYLRNNCDLITTGLESHNFISMNLHIKMGFKFTYSHNAYHFWNLG